MPRISEFFGVVIYMYYNDHQPPHFHAEYAEAEAVYGIETLETLRGELPRRAHAMVVEWATRHRPDLREDWDLARRRMPLRWIAPLD
ncbi:MAG TPA: DUF4160 domain-containing protein [Blastocatellia bacterium]|nr:DUF4160 domain-containing protein [Blastocatellia bacterium]